MLDKLSEVSRLAIEACDTSVVDKTADDKPVGNWFSRLCEGLYPKGKAGTDLHYTTGFEERSCQRYAAGSVNTSGDFVRALLRSPQGATWLTGIMDGSDARWWREHQRALRIAEQVDKIDIS